jgi:hypothetical protein
VTLTREENLMEADATEPEFPVRPIELRGGDRLSDFVPGEDALPDEVMPSALAGTRITADPSLKFWPDPE